MSAEEEIRLACLDRAFLVHEKFETKDTHILDTARRIVDFVCGTNDAEIIRAAHDLAEKCRKAIPQFDKFGGVVPPSS